MAAIIDSSRPHCGRCPLSGMCLSGDHVDELWLKFDVCCQCGVLFSVNTTTRSFIDPYAICARALFYMVKHGGLGSSLCSKEACRLSYNRTQKEAKE